MKLNNCDNMISTINLTLNFLFGMLVTFSPCLFPVLPTFVAYSVKSNQSRKNSITSSLGLITGILVIFLIIGSVTNLIGMFLLNNYSKFAIIQSTILIIAGILLIKTPSLIYKIKLPNKFQKILDGDTEISNPFIMGFMLGLVFALIAAPCASGFFIYIWGGLIGKSFLDQFLLVLAFGIGIGLPFLLIGFFMPNIGGETIGKIHQFNKYVSVLLGLY